MLKLFLFSKASHLYNSLLIWPLVGEVCIMYTSKYVHNLMYVYVCRVYITRPCHVLSFCLSLKGLKSGDVTDISCHTWAQKSLLLSWYCTSWQHFHHYNKPIYTCSRLSSNSLWGSWLSSNIFNLGTSVLASSSVASARLRSVKIYENPQRELVVCWYTHWFSFQETARGLKPIERVRNYGGKGHPVKCRSEHWKLSKTTEKKHVRSVWFRYNKINVRKALPGLMSVVS